MVHITQTNLKIMHNFKRNWKFRRRPNLRKHVTVLSSSSLWSMVSESNTMYVIFITSTSRAYLSLTSCLSRSKLSVLATLLSCLPWWSQSLSLSVITNSVTLSSSGWPTTRTRSSTNVCLVVLSWAVSVQRWSLAMSLASPLASSCRRTASWTGSLTLFFVTHGCLSLSAFVWLATLSSYFSRDGFTNWSVSCKFSTVWSYALSHAVSR